MSQLLAPELIRIKEMYMEYEHIFTDFKLV